MLLHESHISIENSFKNFHIKLQFRIYTVPLQNNQHEDLVIIYSMSFKLASGHWGYLDYF